MENTVITLGDCPHHVKLTVMHNREWLASYRYVDTVSLDVVGADGALFFSVDLDPQKADELAAALGAHAKAMRERGE